MALKIKKWNKFLKVFLNIFLKIEKSNLQLFFLVCISPSCGNLLLLHFYSHIFSFSSLYSVQQLAKNFILTCSYKRKEQSQDINIHDHIPLEYCSKGIIQVTLGT